MKRVLFLFLVLSSFIFGKELNISRAILTEQVENREPVNEKSIFKENEKAYLFTELLDVGDETNIFHKWYTIDEEGNKNLIFDIKLRVKGIRWRTWSNKTLSIPGKWKVEIEDVDGNILKSIDFEVEAEKEIIEDSENDEYEEEIE